MWPNILKIARSTYHLTGVQLPFADDTVWCRWLNSAIISINVNCKKKFKNETTKIQ